jgi:hypothetical protein
LLSSVTNEQKDIRVDDRGTFLCSKAAQAIFGHSAGYNLIECFVVHEHALEFFEFVLVLLVPHHSEPPFDLLLPFLSILGLGLAPIRIRFWFWLRPIRLGIYLSLLVFPALCVVRVSFLFALLVPF